MKQGLTFTSGKIHTLTTVILALVFLSGCSSGSSGGGGGTNTSQNWPGGALQSLTHLEGTWLKGRCAAIGANSVKNYYQITATGTDKASLTLGNIQYTGNTVCSGAGANIGGTLIGTATFSGTDDQGAKKYYYSVLKMISGIQENQIWALKSSTLLCILTRTDDLKTADDVNAYVNSVDNQDCHNLVP